MPWPLAPSTASTGQVVSAAFWNTEVRDAIAALAAGHGAKYKTADETVNNSTTLQNDDHLSWAIAANEQWAFDGLLYYTIASGDPGIKTAFTVPSGASGFRIEMGGNVNLGSSFASVGGYNLSITATAAWGPTSVTSGLIAVRGVVINGATPGTVQFQWAQNSLVASNLILKAGSHFNLKRLA